MPLSMTGFGAARRAAGERAVSAEVRTVNNRFLKVTVRLPDSHAAYEPELEKLVRAAIARGTVHLAVRIERAAESGRYRLDTEQLQQYVEQARAAAVTMRGTIGSIGSLMGLPGVVTERPQETADPAADWPAVSEAVTAALENLDEFRRTEGAAMAAELRANVAAIEAELAAIAEHVPEIVREYRDRLHERVAELLRGTAATVDEASLIREVSLFADRTDINEEVVRLRSHLTQFEAFLRDPQSQGRKLEFLTQEVGREVNTIGSKANSASVAHRVVEMKAAVEKIREVLANVE